jgi:hypothetical protein
MSDHFDLIEIDNPSGLRRPAAPDVVEPIKLDLTTPGQDTCVNCETVQVVGESGECRACFEAYSGMPGDAMPLDLDSVISPTALTDDLAAISSAASASAANVAANTIGSMAGGQMFGVGFSSREGYEKAVRNGVPPHTHAEYITRIRAYGATDAEIAALPGPMVQSDLPVGVGIKHVPTGPSIFDLPREQRRALVTAPPAHTVERINVHMPTSTLVAGAVAEGHHAIVAWEGSTGTTRGQLVAELEAIGLGSWAPKAPNARAQAGSAIARLGSQGLHVRSLRKGDGAAELSSGEHVWTVGTVNHTGLVGEEYGKVRVRFKLSGAVLSFVGDETIGAPVVADFAARMASEVFKSSDLTSWLGRKIRWDLDGVRFGAMGWLVPARHVEQATKLCKAVQSAGFGTGWVQGLPVATSDQLRDGIVRGLIDEVTELLNKLSEERENAAVAAEASDKRYLAAGNFDGDRKRVAMGDIGAKRAATYLKDLRAIGARVVAYGEVLGEQRVDQAQRWIRDAITKLEEVLGSDYTGISARFDAVWEEIEHDRKLAGGVL